MQTHAVSPQSGPDAGPGCQLQSRLPLLPVTSPRPFHSIWTEVTGSEREAGLWMTLIGQERGSSKVVPLVLAGVLDPLLYKGTSSCIDLGSQDCSSRLPGSTISPPSHQLASISLPWLILCCSSASSAPSLALPQLRERQQRQRSKVPHCDEQPARIARGRVSAPITVTHKWCFVFAPILALPLCQSLCRATRGGAPPLA